MSQARSPEINGLALKDAREKQGMERAELASKCCLSTKMIVELEEGGISSFYNFQLKVSRWMTSSMKVLMLELHFHI